MSEWRSPFELNARQLAQAKAAMIDAKMSSAKHIIIEPLPWDVKSRPFNQDTPSARRRPDSFKFAEKPGRAPRDLGGSSY